MVSVCIYCIICDCCVEWTYIRTYESTVYTVHSPGPFWVCMTLVVILSVALHMVKAVKSDSWSFDFSTSEQVFG